MTSTEELKHFAEELIEYGKLGEPYSVTNTELAESLAAYIHTNDIGAACYKVGGTAYFVTNTDTTRAALAVLLRERIEQAARETERLRAETTQALEILDEIGG